VTPLREWSVKDRLLGILMIACYAYGFAVLVLAR
jgi:hypothetical protein